MHGKLFRRVAIYYQKCNKNEDYHMCSVCNQVERLCVNCFNTVHFGINSPRTGKSMVYNKTFEMCLGGKYYQACLLQTSIAIYGSTSLYIAVIQIRL
jgi:hypothetical protein